MINLCVTDKRHQALLFVIDKVFIASATCHVARRVHVESALVMLRPKLSEPDIPAVHCLIRQRLMGNIFLCLPAAFVAHSWPQSQIIVVEIYNIGIESYLLHELHSIRFNSFNILCFLPKKFLVSLSHNKIEIRINLIQES